MINTDELCMSCMREIGEEKQCPFCGFHADSPQIAPYLPIRSTIANRYLVGKLIDYNGDGASYMGWDLSAKSPVVIREFMPDAIASREQNKLEVTVNPGKEDVYSDCLQSFTELWRKLLRLTGLSALIEVTDIIEENNTAYAIEEYVEGITLREYLLRTPTGYISWEKARPLFMPVLSTLGNLHTSGIIHRGISPTNLIIGPDGKLRISGFSISEIRTSKSELNSQLFTGYAAIEQCGFEGQQGPWTDIYAFAAVLYRALIGTDPIDSTQRVTNDRLMIPGKFAEQLPAYVINGLINALQIYPEDRTKNVEQWRAELSAAPSASFSLDDEATAVLPRESSKTPVSFLDGDDEEKYIPKNKKSSANNNTKTIVIISAIVIVLAVIIGIFALGGNKSDNDKTTEPVLTEDTDGTIPVPSLIGAVYELRKNSYGDLFKFELVYENSDEYEKGLIISQYPESGERIKKGSAIRVVVSKGPKSIKLINVVGLTFDEAKAKLEEIGFRVSTASRMRENDGTHAANTISSMSPCDMNAEYQKGATVVLEVWDEVQTTTTTLPEQTTVSDDTPEPGAEENPDDDFPGWW